MTVITVEPAGVEDHADIADFIGQLYGASDYHLDRAGLAGRADDMLAAGPVYFLSRAGQRLGYAALKDMGDHMFVRHFVIDKAHRRKGVGSEAFAALERACFSGRQVRLDASIERSEPRAFWESQGFQIMGYSMRRDPGSDALNAGGGTS
ncbi:MAG: GNAT family N-acetyltransferase [Pseudomonadota bacterium]